MSSKLVDVLEGQRNFKVHKFKCYLDFTFVKTIRISPEYSRVNLDHIHDYGNSKVVVLFFKPLKRDPFVGFRTTAVLVTHIDPLAMCCTSCLARAVLFWDCVGFRALRSAQSQCADHVWPGVTRFSLSLSSLSRKRRGAPSAHSGSERIDALRYQRIKKAKKMTMNNNNSKTRKKAGKQLVSLCA